MEKFKVVEEILRNDKVVSEEHTYCKNYKESYVTVKEKINKYLRDILETKEVETFNIFGNGVDFTIKDNYYVDSDLETEEINITIVERD